MCESIGRYDSFDVPVNVCDGALVGIRLGGDSGSGYYDYRQTAMPGSGGSASDMVDIKLDTDSIAMYRSGTPHSGAPPSYSSPSHDSTSMDSSASSSQPTPGPCHS